jgi:hypothetical protein
MSKTGDHTHNKAYPMRIQARPRSPAEKLYFELSKLPGIDLAATTKSDHPEDLMFHGGKTVKQMGFRNIYLGANSDWAASDRQLIDDASKRAMQDTHLNNVMAQYFSPGLPTCEALVSLLLNEPHPTELDEPDVQAKVVAQFHAGKLGNSDLDRTIFNLLLPPGCVLKLGPSNSLNGLGGYHGSVKTGNTTLYYSANVFSQFLGDQRENGIVAFDAPWKNVVATLYHEMNEFRTDADVTEAINNNSNDFLGWMSVTGHECGDDPIFAAGNALQKVFREVAAANGGTPLPVQFLYSNKKHGAEGPVNAPNPSLAPFKNTKGS